MKPYQIFNRHFKLENIQKVYDEHIKNKPSVGIDGRNIKSFEKNLDDELKIIRKKVLNNTYNFSFYKEKLISKGKDKNPRVISIPTIRDKIVLKIISQILYEIYEQDLSTELVHTKVDKIKNNIQNEYYDSFIKIDIENFYPSINHKILMKIIHLKTKKIEFTTLLQKAIKQETMSQSYSYKEKYTNPKGVPQGLSISNILASIYLISIDQKYATSIFYKYYRYVDDILVLCKKEDIDSIYKSLKTDMKKLRLCIHDMGLSTQKTDSGTIEKGFYFLGYFFSINLISVRESSINKMHNSIINIFAQYKYSRTQNIQLLLWKLNLKITGCKFEDKKYGWLFFFSQITDVSMLYRLDDFIQKMFIKFNLKDDRKKIKKFSRTYYEIIKNKTNTKYIPNLSEMSFEEKKDIVKNIFGFKYIQDSNVERKFDSIIYKNIKQMEEDIQMY